MKRPTQRRDATTGLPWESVPDLLYRVHGANGTIQLLSAAFATHTGWSVAEWIGRPFAELVCAEDLQRANDRYAAILSGEMPARNEMRIRTKAGGFVVGEFHSAPVIQRGRVVGEQGVARDITDRRLAEEARDAREERFRTLFESTDEALFLMDGPVFLDINPKGLEMFGLHDRSDIIGHSPVDFSPPLQPDGRDSREQALAYILAALQGCPQRFYWKHARKDGATFDAEVSLNALTLYGRVHLQATVRDITARRAAEQAMRTSEKRFRLLAAQVPADVWTTDADLRLTSISGSLVPPVERLDLRRAGTTLYELFATRDNRHPVIAAHRRALGGVSAQYERMAGPMLIEGRVEPLRDGTGAVVGCVGVALDITERQRARGAMRRLADFVESSEDAIVTTARDGTIETWNPAAERLYGYPAREAVGRPITLIVPPDSVAEFQHSMRLLEQGQPVGRYEAHRVRADGRGINVSVTLSAIRDGRGVLVGFSGIVRDITERQRAQEALQASETRFRTLAGTAPVGIFCTDPQGLGTYLNDRLLEILGLKREEAAGFGWLRSIHPDDRERVEAELALAHATGQPWRSEHRAVRPDGAVTWVLAQSAIERDDAGRVIGTIGTITDITQHKQAEQALRASEERLQSLFAGIDDALFVHDAEGRILDCNEAACRRLGYSREELLALRTSDIDAPEFAEGFRDRLAQQFDRGRFVGEGVHLTKDGRHIPVDINSSVIDYHGKKAVLAVMRDISERRRVEEALRRSEAEYRGLVEQAPLGIYRTTSDGRSLRVNRALVAMLGYASPEALLQMSAGDFYADPEERTRLVERIAQQGEAKVETQWKRKDASLITVRLNVRLVRDPASAVEYFEGIVEDVTAQRSLENQFRQAQRLEAVGRLAGGVAHDFNNVLTAITGYSELLLDEFEPGDPKRQDVEEIHAAAQRAAGLTRQLLAFSRKQVFQTRVLDLNAVVRMLEKMVQRLIGEDVKLETALSSGLGAVRADPGQLEQVILNLAVNSRDAMPSGGRFTIETANADLDETYAGEHAGASAGRYVMLAISDTGIGMDAETQSHIFEPFFTTKEQGTGTGLGLATVYGIVKQSGGFVWVYSEPGGGATFKIYLPRVDEPVEALEPAPSAPATAGGSETVLLAEDDPSVREVVAEVLTQKGYRVLQAPDGQAALEMARAEPGDIRLLVTDLVMPRMTGRELAEALVAERAGVRVLYMSGYTDDAVVRHGVLEEGLPYLQKPFTPRALATKVREVLDRASMAAGAS